MQALLDQFANQDAISQKIVQVGSLQPFDLVRVHSNPTNLVLTNTHDRNVATTTVVLLTDGQTRTGLKFKPDAVVINERHDQTLNLIVASSINQTISIEFADYPAKEVKVLANQPAIVNIGVLYGIPLISSTASFFDVATGDDGGSSGGVPSIFSTLLQAVETNAQLSYTSGDLSAAGQSVSFGYVAIKPVTDGECLSIIVPALTIHQQLKFSLLIQSAVSNSVSSAWVSIIRIGDDTIVRNTDKDFIVQPGTILGIRRDANKLIAECASDDSISPANLDVVGSAYLHVIASNPSSADVPSLQIHAPNGEEG
jgi:hypothetical protein